jgi:rod shape-determining protein MreD
MLSIMAISAQATIELPRFLQPSFPFLLALVWGLVFGPAQAVAAAALNGLLVDVVSTGPLGSHLVATLVISLFSLLPVAGFVERRLAEALVVVPLATVVYYLVLTLILTLSGRPLDVAGNLGHIWLPVIVANTLWSFPFLGIVGYVHDRSVRLSGGVETIRPFTPFLR